MVTYTRETQMERTKKEVLKTAASATVVAATLVDLAQ